MHKKDGVCISISQAERVWKIHERDPELETRLGRELGISGVLATILRNRALTDPEECRRFLAPAADHLHDPFILPDMEPAIDRLLTALETGEKILVHGDYDADGVTSTAVLVRVLKKLGGQVLYHVPHRFHDHYGLSVRAVDGAAAQGVGLVIAVDCGVSDFEAVAAARAAGMDVIVVDHHQPGPHLPEGALVVNPKRADSVYPFSELAAVGLAYKVASALCLRMDIPESYLLRAFSDLVAVGTIADVVPLKDENRVLAWYGLQQLPKTRKAGLRALLNLCDLNGTVSAQDVSFRLAPRLNAVGRMGDANEALTLLLTEDDDEAIRLSLLLESLNRERQREQERIYREARNQADKQLDGDDACPALVLSGEGWHFGVVGIVASKIMEEFNCPAVIICEEDPECHGSGRSLEGFHMADAFAHCDDLLIRYGGHALAGGLTLHREVIPRLRERLCELAQVALCDKEVGALVVDCETTADEITPDLVEELKSLEPCGQDNPPPLLMTRDLEVMDVRQVGQEGRHLKLSLSGEGLVFDAIGFRMGPQKQWINSRTPVDIVYTPEFNEYNGRTGLQLRLEDIRPAQ